MPTIGAGELIIILIIVLLVFGSSRLPKLARSVGQASKEFRKGVDEADRAQDEDSDERHRDAARDDQRDDQRDGHRDGRGRGERRSA